MLRRCIPPLAAVLLLVPFAVAPAVRAQDCQIGTGLGSTVLIPYFEYDPTAGADGATTLFSVNNEGNQADADPGRCCGPTGGSRPSPSTSTCMPFDVQSINVRDLFNGNIPSTGEGEDLSGFNFCGTETFRPNHANPVPAGDRAGADPGRPHAAWTGRWRPSAPARTTATASRAATSPSTWSTSAAASSSTRSSPPPGPATSRGRRRRRGHRHRPEPHLGRLPDRRSGERLCPGLRGGGPVVRPGSLHRRPDLHLLRSLSAATTAATSGCRCPTLWATRFLDGGPFSGGTDLIVWRDTAALG